MADPVTPPLGKRLNAAALLDYLKADLRFDVIKDFKSYAFALAAAKKAGIEVGDGELQEAVDAFRESHGLLTAKETQDWLSQAGLSEEDLERLTENRVKISKLKRKIIEERIKKYWAEKNPQYDAARLSQIVVKTKPLAQELKAKLEDGEAPFYELARRYSEDPLTKDAGGYVGVVHRSAMPPTLQAEAFAASPGDVLGPLDLDGQFVLVEVRETRQAKLDTCRPAVEKALWQEWLQENLAHASAMLVEDH